MLFPVAYAEIKNSLVKTQNIQESPLDYGVVKVLLTWLSVFVGVIGFFILLSALFFYLLAAGEEPKMKRANNALWVGLFCLIGAVVLYSIGIWLG